MSNDKEFEHIISKVFRILPMAIYIKTGVKRVEEVEGRYIIDDRGDKYIITVEVPGASKDDVKVYAKEYEVFVYAKRKLSHEHTPKIYRVRVKLDEPIDVENTKAKYINGLVIIEALKKTPGTEIKVE